MFDLCTTANRLETHLKKLTIDIGERSIRYPKNLEKTVYYIEDFYLGLDLHVERETYRYRDFEVSNVISCLPTKEKPLLSYILGAHYDSVVGTVGADDNASAIAVQMETARELKAHFTQHHLPIKVKFVSFALEEPPTFGTRYMGSRVHAKGCKRKKERLDGMICLEMVGYTCCDPGCQKYPFPLMFMDYPKSGDFIGIVGNLRSKGLTNSLYRSFKKNSSLPVVKLTVPLGGYSLPAVGLSDHSSFWHNGYKAVMITDTAFYRNPHYHRPTDTMDKLDYDFMAQLVKSLVIHMGNLDQGLL